MTALQCLPTSPTRTPRLSDFTGRGIRGDWAWDRAPEVVAGKGKPYPKLRWVQTRVLGVPGRSGAGSWVCWAIRSCWSAKGEWRKVNRVAWGRREWKAEHSIRAESEGRGGGLRGACPARVLGERGATFTHLLVFGSGGYWETGLLLFYLGCRCPRAATTVPVSQVPCIPPLPASASSCAGSGAAGSCPAPVQLTDTWKPTKTLLFFFP